MSEMRSDFLPCSMGCLLCAVCLVMCVATTARAENENFEARVFHDEGGQTLPYRLMKPAKYDPQTAYPVVVFLHGAGERGTDNKAQLIHVVSIFEKPENRAKYPCFVVVPQCPVQDKWVEVKWADVVHKQPEKPSQSLTLALKTLESLRKEFNIDANRQYIMGISMGGFGTWDAISRHPNLFAAAVPICGGGDKAVIAKAAKVPVWAFHGAKDSVVKPVCTHDMIEALKQAGGSPRFTEFPDCDHNSWDSAAAQPELLPWLFSQKRLP